MDQELREKVAKQEAAWEFYLPVETIQKEWDKATEEERSQYLKRADIIDALYQSHYAEKGKGLELTPAQAQLAKVQPLIAILKGEVKGLLEERQTWEARQKEAVRAAIEAERVKINKILEPSSLSIGTISAEGQIETYIICDIDGDEIDPEEINKLMTPYYWGEEAKGGSNG